MAGMRPPLGSQTERFTLNIASPLKKHNASKVLYGDIMIDDNDDNHRTPMCFFSSDTDVLREPKYIYVYI